MCQSATIVTDFPPKSIFYTDSHSGTYFNFARYK